MDPLEKFSDQRWDLGESFLETSNQLHLVTDLGRTTSGKDDSFLFKNVLTLLRSKTEN